MGAGSPPLRQTTARAVEARSAAIACARLGRLLMRNAGVEGSADGARRPSTRQAALARPRRGAHAPRRWLPTTGLTLRTCRMYAWMRSCSGADLALQLGPGTSRNSTRRRLIQIREAGAGREEGAVERVAGTLPATSHLRSNARATPVSARVPGHARCDQLRARHGRASGSAATAGARLLAVASVAARPVGRPLPRVPSAPGRRACHRQEPRRPHPAACRAQSPSDSRARIECVRPRDGPARAARAGGRLGGHLERLSGLAAAVPDMAHSTPGEQAARRASIADPGGRPSYGASLWSTENAL